MWYANVIAGVAVLLLGVATTVLAWTTLPYSGEFGPGPGFLPFWLGIALVVCAVPVVIADLRCTVTSEKWFRPETAKCLQVLGLIVAVYLTLPVLGFSVGLGFITGGGMRLMGRHRWASCAVTVIGTAVCIHFLFGQWLGIPLPKGLIGW
jgi:putative tricarboxylic transport membrane protein